MRIRYEILHLDFQKLFGQNLLSRQARKIFGNLRKDFFEFVYRQWADFSCDSIRRVFFNHFFSWHGNCFLDFNMKEALSLVLTMYMLLTVVDCKLAKAGTCQDLFRIGQIQVRAWDSSKFTPIESFSTDRPYMLLAHGITDRFPTLWEHPELVSRVPFMSVSVITNEKPNTLSNSGLVIAASDRNVVATSPIDMFLPQKSESEVANAIGKYGRKPPEAILKETKDPFWNEIILSKHSETDIRPIGYFIVISSDNRPLVTEKTFNMIKKKSSETGLPIIYIRNHQRNRAHDGIEWD